MDEAYIIKQVQKVRDHRRDPEVAHALEDDIRNAVLKKISRMKDPAKMRALARAALKTGDIQFPRYTA
jgi:hypothetical protein